MASYNSDQLLKGDELFVYVKTGSTTGNTDYAPIAYSTSCSLNISADSIDTSNKMAGVWASALAGKLSWTISTEALMSYDNTGYSYFFDKLVDRTPFLIKFGQVTNLASGDFTMNASKVYYTGQAYCTSCNLTADNGGVCTMSIEFTGDGALTKTGDGKNSGGGSGNDGNLEDDPLG